MSEINQDVEGQGFDVISDGEDYGGVFSQQRPMKIVGEDKEDGSDDDGGVFSQQRPVKIAEEGTGDVKKSSKRKSKGSRKGSGKKKLKSKSGGND